MGNLLTILFILICLCGYAIYRRKIGHPLGDPYYSMRTPGGPTKIDRKIAAMRSTVPPEVHCPMCGSNRIGRITKSQKFGSAAMWGIFAINRVSKTFVCFRCNYRF